MFLDPRQQHLLEGNVLRTVFLHEVDALQGFGHIREDGDLARLASGRVQVVEIGEKARADAGEPFRGVGAAVVHAHVETVMRECGGPALANDAEADNADGFH